MINLGLVVVIRFLSHGKGDVNVLITQERMMSLIGSVDYRVRNFRGRVSYFDQSEARKDRFLASDWSKHETLPRKYRTVL